MDKQQALVDSELEAAAQKKAKMGAIALFLPKTQSNQFNIRLGPLLWTTGSSVVRSALEAASTTPPAEDRDTPGLNWRTYLD